MRIWVAVSLFAGLAGAACGDPRVDSPWSHWSNLHFKAKAAPFIRGQLEMSLQHDPGGSRLETRTSASFLGKRLARSRTVTELDATTGKPKRYVNYSANRGRRYEFGTSTYVVEKLRPEERTDTAPEDWPVTSRAEFPYPAAEATGATERVFDYYGMLLELRHLPLSEPGDETTLYVATSKGPQPYRIIVGERRSVEREYTDLGTGEQKKETLRELRLRIVPADPANADEGFLRMEGETEIWVEERSKTLLEISGKIPKVPGRVKLRLTAMG